MPPGCTTSTPEHPFLDSCGADGESSRPRGDAGGTELPLVVSTSAIPESRLKYLCCISSRFAAYLPRLVALDTGALVTRTTRLSRQR